MMLIDKNSFSVFSVLPAKESYVSKQALNRQDDASPALQGAVAAMQLIHLITV